MSRRKNTAYDPAEYRTLRKQFVEAAAKYEPAGYRTFIERGARSEEDHIRTGRCEFVGRIHWFYKPWRECMIFAPSDGFGERPFSVMRRLCTKAWLWLPEIMAEGVVRVAELHLSPPPEFGLAWEHHQLWVWLLWFDWLWRSPREEPPMPPAAGMDLLPFSSSARLISDWGLDEADPRIPAWLAEVVRKDEGRARSRRQKVGRKKSTNRGEAQVKLIAALTKHHRYADGGCLNLEPIGNNELARLAVVSESTASEFFKKEFQGHTKYRALCGDTTRLVGALKLLNQEFSPHHLYGGKPPGEDEWSNE